MSSKRAIMFSKWTDRNGPWRFQVRRGIVSTHSRIFPQFERMDPNLRFFLPFSFKTDPSHTSFSWRHATYLRVHFTLFCNFDRTIPGSLANPFPVSICLFNFVGESPCRNGFYNAPYFLLIYIFFCDFWKQNPNQVRSKDGKHWRTLPG